MGEPMTDEQIISSIRDLATSRGFYGRLYNALMEAPAGDRECFIGRIREAGADCDLYDLVMYLEGAL